MTTITPKPGNPSAAGSTAGPSLRERPAAPGTLTAVPHADQPRTTQKDAPATPPGAPRPVTARPTPLGELATLLGIEASGSGSARQPSQPQPPQITGITHDSRAVRPGDLYAALPGAKLHGADFAAQAAALGAAAVLTDPAGADRAAATGLPVLAVADPRARMGELAATIYGRPGEGLLQIGITGTSGKTTTAYLVEGGLRGAGRSTGLVGTVEMRIGDERIKSERTTPEATDLQALFAVMRERGVEAVAMEVSSHALVLGRVDGCVFDVAVFNNLSPEHMEFHSDMEDYFQAKAQLFTERRARLGVVNVDDEYGRRLAKETTIPVVTVSAAGVPAAG
ncbi:Mur ligase family protein, partial [Streptomyces sp. NPDC059456]|uniref:Mur ligase family protein n=1 Tax=Streptomyces sp. NPDC059456 TaxID=3346838 RepID=UPI0036840407